MAMLGLLSALGLSAAPLHAQSGEVDLPRHPSISPDGSTILFSWRGDLWSVPSTGGQAIRLTNHPANDSRSAFSPDGRTIAFNSTRNGFNNIYTMSINGTDIQQVTDTDRSCRLIGFETDNNGDAWIAFDSVQEPDVYRERRPYMVSVDGGDLIRVHDAFGAEPDISSDGSMTVFSRGGYYDGWDRRHYRGAEAADVWLHDRNQNTFTQLTDWDGNDGMARWGGNRTILFASDREDRTVNLFRMSAREGEQTIARLTNFTERDLVDYDITADGSLAVMHVWDALYTLDLNDPQAAPKKLSITATQDARDHTMLKSINREVSEAALSPDGQVMAVVAFGEIFIRNVDDDSPTRRVTNNHAVEDDLAWSPDGLKLYFSSDIGGSESIYAARVETTRSDIEEAYNKATGQEDEEEAAEDAEPETEDEPADANGADDAAAPADDPVTGIWEGTANVPEAGALPYSMTIYLEPGNNVSGTIDAAMYSGSISGSYDPDSRTLNFSLSSQADVSIDFTLVLGDGELTGTAVGGEIVVQISAQRTGDAPARDDNDAEADQDEKKKDKDLPKELQTDRWHDALTFTIETVLDREVNDRQPTPSPDGQALIVRSTRGTLDLLELETGEIRTLFEHWDAWVDFSWSPCSRYIAYAQSDLNFNDDIFVLAVDGESDPVNITKHPDNDSNPNWSADGKVISFVSERVNEQFDVWMVYLDPELDGLTNRERKAYYDEQVKAAKKRKPLPVENPEEDDQGDEDNADANDESENEDEAEIEEPAWDLETAYRRTMRLTSLLGNEGGLAMTPAGDRLIFNTFGDVSGLYSIKYDGSDRKQLTGSASIQHLSLTGDKVVIVSGGRAGTIKPDGGSVEYYNVSHTMNVDLEQLSEQKFLAAARTLGEQYYHPTMNGLDWEALTADYLELARRARTVSEFNWVANRFIGELNGSHMGIRGANTTGEDTSPTSQGYGYIGVTTERTNDGLKITSIIERAPAEEGSMPLEIGDIITAVEFETIGPRDTLRSKLKGRTRQETIFSITRMIENEDGETEPQSFSVFVTPSSYGNIRQLGYEQWRRNNARIVEEMSDGRLGYIHIQAMGQAALDVFERDLFAAAEGKDGLVLDVRNNGGGWTTDRVLASIMVQSHSYTVPRGASWDIKGHYPQDRLFIQRYLMPMNLLCNEKSYSNAEIMSHAFKTLNRGTLIGQQTHGSVISTGGFSLVDGTFVRLPFRGWFVDDGTDRDMELNGALPDLVVPQIPADEIAGNDEQLRVAVEDLLKRLD